MDPALLLSNVSPALLNPFSLFNRSRDDLPDLDVLNSTGHAHNELDPLQLLPNVTALMDTMKLMNVSNLVFFF
jgi:hypothetical protein